MAKRKVKIPAARQALYDSHNCTPEQIQGLERDLHAPKFEILAKMYEVVPEPPEEARLAILQKHFQSKQDNQGKIERCSIAREKHFHAFYQIFRQPLSRFWQGYLGFDVIKFDQEIVKSGDRACGDVVREKFGDEALQIVNELLGKDETPARSTEELSHV